MCCSVIVSIALTHLLLHLSWCQVLEITEAMFTDVPGRHYTNCGFTIVVIPPSTEKREFNLLAEVSGLVVTVVGGVSQYSCELLACWHNGCLVHRCLGFTSDSLWGS